MREKFPGYFRLADEQIQDQWTTALFVFDANILLNLYRYSSDTQTKVFKILDRMHDRLWIPYQAAKEFLARRVDVIMQQQKAYEEIDTGLQKILDKFENKSRHPFISQLLLQKTTKLFEELRKELDSSKAFHEGQVLQDTTLQRIEKLCHGRIGDDFSEDRFEELRKEGENRYKNNTPPGYKDNTKDTDGLHRYGDFFIWKQILEKAKTESSNVILVTDDRKEDWWTQHSGKTLHPRPELIKEFIEDTGQTILIYQSDRFIEYASSFFEEELDKGAIEEIREIKDTANKINKVYSNSSFIDAVSSVQRARLDLMREISNLQEQKERYIKQLKFLEDSGGSALDQKGRVLSQLHALETKLAVFQSRSKEIDDMIRSPF